MGNCENTIELLNQYADGELNESDAAFVRAHLEECEECQKAYCQLLEIEKLFKSTADTQHGRDTQRSGNYSRMGGSAALFGDDSSDSRAFQPNRH